MKPAIVLALGALALGGCSNMVFSAKPLFKPSDSRDAPDFRPGAWATNAPGCAVDTAHAVQDWPTCADGLIYGSRGPVVPPQEARLRLVAGDPLILQQDHGEGVMYAGVRPIAYDDRGRISSYEIWIAQCGPPPAPRQILPQDGKVGGRLTDRLTPEGGESSGGLTDHLLPGLKADGDNCLARKRGAVRLSAAKSRAWADKLYIVRWMRDTTPADRQPSGKDVLHLTERFLKKEEAAAEVPAP